MSAAREICSSWDTEHCDDSQRTNDDNRYVGRHHESGAKTDHDVNNDHDDDDRLDYVDDHLANFARGRFSDWSDTGVTAMVGRQSLLKLDQLVNPFFGRLADIDDVGSGLHRDPQRNRRLGSGCVAITTNVARRVFE